VSATPRICRSRACHVTQQDWGIPLRMDEAAEDRDVLVLRGRDAAGRAAYCCLAK
jgi:hypothetical protein